MNYEPLVSTGPLIAMGEGLLVLYALKKKKGIGLESDSSPENLGWILDHGPTQPNSLALKIKALSLFLPSLIKWPNWINQPTRSNIFNKSGLNNLQQNWALAYFQHKWAGPGLALMAQEPKDLDFLEALVSSITMLLFKSTHYASFIVLYIKLIDNYHRS